MHIHKYTKINNRTKLQACLVMVGFGIVGSYFLVGSHASTSVGKFEAESGMLQGAATVLSDTAASNGSAIVFGGNQSVRVDAFGAKGDGVTDDTAAIQTALSALKAGQVLLFTTGKTYNHNAVLKMTVAGTSIAGDATLQATNEQASTLQIMADNVSVSDLTFKMKSTTQRWSAPAQTMVYLDGHAHAQIRNILIDGSPSAGFFSFGAHDYMLENVSVQNTRADAIHNTGGSYNATIVNPVIKNVGDDGVAVVSYTADGVICHDITVTSPKFYGSTNGRAYSVVGGNNVTFSNIYAESSNAATVYIGSEGDPYYTYGTNNIKFLGGVIKNANTNSSVDHGAILILGGQNSATVSNVTVSNMAISGTRSSASRQVSLLNYAGTMNRIQLSSISFTGGGNIFGTYNVAAASYNTVGWSNNGNAIPDHTGFTP